MQYPTKAVPLGARTSFDFDARGDLSEIRHAHGVHSSAELRTFAGVQYRYDHSGNPVIERLARIRRV